MTSYNVLTLCGSLRAESLNKSVEATLPDLAPAGLTITHGPGFADIPHYNADAQAQGFPDPVDALAGAIKAADGVIIVSPEYNYSVPGALKNAIDWLSRHPDAPLAGKPVALQSVSGGALGGARMQYHMRQILVFLESYVHNRPEVFVTFGNQKIEAGRLTDGPTREAVVAQLTSFQAFIGKLK
jgi:chromate reductase